MTSTWMTDVRSLAVRLEVCLSEAQSRWLAQAQNRVREVPPAIVELLPAAGRQVGRGMLSPWDDPDDPLAWTLADAARALLLAAMGTMAHEHLGDLYRHGDRAERRSVLLALPFLPTAQTTARIVTDALRCDDTALVAAVMHPHNLALLHEPLREQAVLKCLFVGIPLRRLQIHVTPRLSAMLARYADERAAAGRDVPADIWPLIQRPTAEVAARAAEMHPEAPAQGGAAREALEEALDTLRT
jgi:hypothetical protein